MKRILLVLFVGGSLGIGVGGVLAWSSSRLESEAVKSRDDRKIPLESIYSTTEQAGLKKPDDVAIADALVRSSGTGVSNIFMVRGNGFSSALIATRRTLSLANAANVTIGPDSNFFPRFHWLVAYIGVVKPAPGSCVVISVEQKGDLIRFNYSRATGPEPPMESQAACFWVPLGEMRQGVYALELYDADKRDVLFMRRQTVGEV